MLKQRPLIHPSSCNSMLRFFHVEYLYNTFYRTEYNGLTDFLIGYYQLEPKYAKEIVELLNDRKELRLYDYNSLSASEYFDDFITSEEVSDRFEKLIMMRV